MSDQYPPLRPVFAARIHKQLGSPEMCHHMRLKDECGFCAADETRKGLERRIECEKVAAVQEFCDRVLGALNRMGINTDDCDGEDAPDVILSGWIYTQIVHARSSSGGGGAEQVGDDAATKQSGACSANKD